VEVAGELCTVAFTQIAGLLARRIVFQRKVGDWVHRGERVGLIKFGSRVDVVFPVSCEVQVRVGQIVHGGSSVLAIMPSSDMEDELLAAISSDEAPFGLVTGPVR
jgi:phosphatidylserine decarboxylase